MIFFHGHHPYRKIFEKTSNYLLGCESGPLYVKVHAMGRLQIFELLTLYQKAKLGVNCQNLMKLFISFAEGIFCLAKRKYSSQTKLRPRQTKLALVKRN